MSELIRIGIFVTVILFIGIPFTYIILKLVYKKSILVPIGTIMTGTVSVIVIQVHYSEHMGLIHMIWGVPLAVSIVMIGLKLIQKVLIKPSNDILNTISKIAEGDLSVRIDENIANNKNELGLISNEVNTMVLKMSEVLNNVLKISNSVVTVSSSLKVDSGQMAQLANEQAASVEEVSATMEEMASGISQSSENSHEAETIAKKSAVKIDINNKNVQKATEALEVILKKIGVISEIAFQTNILSLNAAIEASKAGEFGKGFNVVASEIRKLSNRSKAAALEINDISKNSMKISERTSRISEQIVPDVKKTYKIVKEISTSTKEQNLSAVQVNNSVQQLNRATQELANVSQKLSMSSGHLSEFAYKLTENMKYFTHTGSDVKKSSNKENPELKTKAEKKNNPEEELLSGEISLGDDLDSGFEINLPKGDDDNDFEKF